MEVESRWMFTKEQIANTPSRKYNIDAESELQTRQRAAMFIQDMAQGLRFLSQLSVNTAIVYMHRFYMFHSLTNFCKYKIGIASLFLASKTEDVPLRMEHILIQAHRLLYKNVVIDMRSEHYLKIADDLLFNENILLMTLGFDLTVKHPHAEVVKGCTMIKASKELTSTCYLMASNSLHLTMMCLQYSPKVVACFCIHLASKWSNYQIQMSRDGRPWYTYVDRSVTEELLEELTEEFLRIFDKCSSKLKKAARRGQISLESHQEKQNAVSHRGYQSQHGHHKQNAHRRDYRKHSQSSQNRVSEIAVGQPMPRPESDQRLLEQNIPFPTPPCSQKSIFSPEESYSKTSPKESQEWNKSQPKNSPLSQVLIPVSVASSINLVVPVAAPSVLQQNLLKRRASGDANSSRKRHCSSFNFEKSAIVTEEISSIIKTSVISPELHNPSNSLPGANISSICDTKFYEEAKPFDQVFSERALTHKALVDLPLDNFDNGIERQNNLINPIMNLPTSNLSLVTETKFPVIANSFSFEPTLTHQNTSNYLVTSLDANHENKDLFIQRSLPKVKQELKSTPVSNDQPRIKSEDEIRYVKIESPAVEVELLPSTVDFSEVLSVPREGNNVKRKEHKKSKKSKKDKKKKKHKERKREKRKNKTKDNENMNDDETRRPLMPIKISIPKEKLNLSIESPIASGSKIESPKNGSLKIRICKNRVSSSDTKSSSPIPTVKTPLKLKILKDTMVILPT